MLYTRARYTGHKQVSETKKYKVGENGVINTNSRYEVPDYSYFRLRVDLLRGEHDSN